MALGDEMKKLGEDIVISQDTRVKSLGDIVSATRKTLKGAGKMVQGFHKERGEMSDALMESLAEFKSSLSEKVEGLLKDFRVKEKEDRKALQAKLSRVRENTLKAKEELVKSVAKMREDSRSSHKEMAATLKKDLIEAVEGVEKAAEKITSEASSLVKEFGKEHEAMASAWKGMTKTLAQKRKGIVAKPAVKKIASPRKKTKENQILAIVRENPDGITLPEIAYTMGVPFVSLAKTIKNLQKAKKVRKREKLYFSV